MVVVVVVVVMEILSGVVDGLLVFCVIKVGKCDMKALVLRNLMMLMMLRENES
jgi:hypothetical protein